MPQLLLEGTSALQSRLCGPSECYYLVGRTIRDSRDEAVAEFHNGSWAARGHFYTHLEFQGSVAIRFQFTDSPRIESRGRSVGVAIFGNALQNAGEYLAFLENARWQCRRTGRAVAAIYLFEEDEKNQENEAEVTLTVAGRSCDVGDGDWLDVRLP
jgi:hypothetical protein